MRRNVVYIENYVNDMKRADRQVRSFDSMQPDYRKCPACITLHLNVKDVGLH